MPSERGRPRVVANAKWVLVACHQLVKVPVGAGLRNLDENAVLHSTDSFVISCVLDSIGPRGLFQSISSQGTAQVSLLGVFSSALGVKLLRFYRSEQHILFLLYSVYCQSSLNGLALHSVSLFDVSEDVLLSLVHVSTLRREHVLRHRAHGNVV